MHYYTFSILFFSLFAAFPTPAQAISTPATGSVVAEYRSQIGGTPLIVGIDLASNAMFRVTRGTNSTFTILLVTAEGDSYTGVAGTSVLLPSETNPLVRDALSRPFPFLLPSLLHGLPDDAFEIVTNSDGSTLYKCKLIAGGIGTTITGLPEGLTSKIHEVDYLFNPDGKLRAITRQTKTETVEYVECDTPSLAIPVSYSAGGWVLHDYEIFPDGNTAIFTPESVVPAVRKMLISFNERARDRSKTPQAMEETAKLITRMSSDSVPWYSKRLTFVITGILVIGVGSLAWWRNRS